jgi:hypothetical protein
MSLENRLIQPHRTLLYIGFAQIAVGLLATNVQFSAWKSEKAYSGYDLIYVSLLIVAIFFGAILCVSNTSIASSSEVRKEVALDHSSVIIRLTKFFTTLVLVGYAIWIILAVTRGLTFSVVLSGLTGQGAGIKGVKNYLGTVPGITTLTQFSSTAAALCGVLRKIGFSSYKYYFTLILVPGILRAVFNAERLALLEPLIAFLIVQLFFGAKLSYKSKIISLVVFPTLFAAFEFTRSWVAYYGSHYDGSFWDFILIRLLAYYATGLNNGFLLLDNLGPGPRFPFYTFNFLFQIPPLHQLLNFQEILGYEPFDGLRSFLRVHGNPEFNNPSGFLVLVMDWGWLISAGVLFLVGFMLGIIYKRAIESDLLAILTYSTLFIGIVEMPRYFYFSTGRAFPIYLAYFWIKKEIRNHEKK